MVFSGGEGGKFKKLMLVHYRWYSDSEFDTFSYILVDEQLIDEEIVKLLDSKNNTRKVSRLIELGRVRIDTPITILDI